MAEENKSLWDKFSDQVLDVGGDVARAWAAGTYGYQTYEAGPGGVYPAGQPAGVKSAAPAYVGGFQLTTGIVVLGVAALVGLYLAFR